MIRDPSSDEAAAGVDDDDDGVSRNSRKLDLSLMMSYDLGVDDEVEEGERERVVLLDCLENGTINKFNLLFFNEL